jgi:hypothetical protein
MKQKIESSVQIIIDIQNLLKRDNSQIKKRYKNEDYLYVYFDAFSGYPCFGAG